MHEGVLFGHKVGREWENEIFEVKGDEDIHSANERRLTELIGSVGGKLHTGRSRNDQVSHAHAFQARLLGKVVTDTRLWLLAEIQTLQQRLRALLTVFCDRAESDLDVLMPGEVCIG